MRRERVLWGVCGFVCDLERVFGVWVLPLGGTVGGEVISGGNRRERKEGKRENEIIIIIVFCL